MPQCQEPEQHVYKHSAEVDLHGSRGSALKRVRTKLRSKLSAERKTRLLAEEMVDAMSLAACRESQECLTVCALQHLPVIESNVPKKVLSPLQEL